MRDITLGDTIYPKFTTRAFATGIPTTLAGTPVLSVYEENNLTQITAGVSVTVDYDSVTGLNQATIVATAGNGYESGKSYDVVITTGTVDSVSVVGEVVFSFTVEASAAAVDLANGTDGLGAIKTDTAAILVDTGTTLDGKINTIDTNVDAILVDTTEIGVAGAGLTNINLPDQTMNITGNITGNLSGSVANVTGGINTAAGVITTLDGLDTAQDTQHATTQAAVAGLNDVAATDIVSNGAITTLAGAVVNVDLVDVTTTNTDMRGTDSAATAAAMATAQSDLDIITGTAGALLDSTATSAQLVDDIWDESLTGHTTNQTPGKVLKGINEGWVAIEGAVNDVSPTTTSFITDLTESTSSFFADQPLVFISGSLKGQSRIVTSYNGTTKTMSFDEAFSFAPANTDQFIVLATHIHTVSETVAAMDANSTQLAAIVADTNELQADWANGGRLDLIIDELTTQGDTNEGKLDTAQSDLDLLTGTDGATLATSQPNYAPATASALTTHDGKLDTVDSIVDAILLDTGTDGVVISAATANQIADALLVRSISNVEDSLGDHMLGTAVQGILESAASGATWNIYKTDGITVIVAKTLTTDAAADPITGVS